MRKNIKKRLPFSFFLLFFSAFLLAASVFAWFYFPMSQYTKVYTDGVLDADVNASVYNYTTASFLPVTVGEQDSKIMLEYRAENDALQTVSPYFFLWGGEYTTNEHDRTIYKVEISYENKMGANPSKLRLYGDFDITSYCVGQNEDIDIKFMSLYLFIPQNGNAGGYTDIENYTEVGTSDTEVSLALIDAASAGGELANFDYKKTLYFMLKTDAAALQDDALTLEDETGILDAVYKAEIKLYFRTEPANQIP